MHQRVQGFWGVLGFRALGVDSERLREGERERERARARDRDRERERERERAGFRGFRDKGWFAGSRVQG